MAFIALCSTMELTALVLRTIDGQFTDSGDECGGEGVWRSVRNMFEITAVLF
eukprot:m.249146 g.249146  ORF g.249146 m.249146 type:complete len:52 (+) comp40299_c1_seq3:113-268(+)